MSIFDLVQDHQYSVFGIQLRLRKSFHFALLQTRLPHLALLITFFFLHVFPVFRVGGRFSHRQLNLLLDFARSGIPLYNIPMYQYTFAHLPFPDCFHFGAPRRCNRIGRSKDRMMGERRGDKRQREAGDWMHGYETGSVCLL